MTDPRPDLEDVVMAGWHGAPELKPHERRQFLGEFAERVLASLTKQEAEGGAVNQAIGEAARDPRARAIVAHADIPFQDRLKYSELAEEAGLTFTIRSDPSHTGDVGLIVVSDEAIAPQT